jgi:aspartate aminotransferase-like enzyme
MSITALRPKSGPATDVVAAMKKRGYVLGGGYGKWKEETFRIGHMGDITIPALESMLQVLGEVCAGGSQA